MHYLLPQMNARREDAEQCCGTLTASSMQREILFAVRPRFILSTSGGYRSLKYINSLTVCCMLMVLGSEASQNGRSSHPKFFLSVGSLALFDLLSTDLDEA
jgi:hypothetical protein